MGETGRNLDLEEFFARTKQVEVFSEIHQRANENLIKELKDKEQVNHRQKHANERMAGLIAKLKNKLEEVERTDPLTGQLSRVGLEKIVLSLKQKGVGGALMFLDLDGFKTVNDTYGHSLGDKVKIAAAVGLKKGCRDSDLVAVWAGDEFVLFFPQATAQEIYEKYKVEGEEKHCIKIPYNFPVGSEFPMNPDMKNPKRDNFITFSGGIVNLEVTDDLDTKTKKADKLMYQAKDAGRDRLIVEEK